MTMPAQQADPQLLRVLADDFRASSALEAAVLIAGVIAAWRQIIQTDVRVSWPPLREVIASLVRTQYREFWSSGLAFYARSRSAAGLGGGAPQMPALPPALPRELVAKTLNTMGPGAMLHGIKGGQQAAQALDNAAVKLAGAAARLALSGSRGAVLQSVGADDQALGWMRVLGPRPCAFCAMLASRGPAYKTQQSAGFQAHNHCMCSAMPVFSKSILPLMGEEELQRQWRRVTKGLSGRDARNAWRRYWDHRHEPYIAVA